MWIGRYIVTTYMHAKIPTKVGTLTIALSQAPSFRRCGLVLVCVSSCERETCANNGTKVRLWNLRANTPQHIRCSLLSLQCAHIWLTPMLENTFASCTCTFGHPPHHHHHRGLIRS